MSIIATQIRSVGPFAATALAIASIMYWTASVQHPARHEPPVMVPCSVGTYWIYRGTSKEQGEGTNLDKTLTEKKVTVVDSIKSDGISACLVEEHTDVQDLSHHKRPSTPNSYTMRLVFDNKRYYEEEEEEDITGQTPISETWRALKKEISDGKIPDEPNPDSLKMKVPSKVGAVWDDLPGRDDGMYCWSVEETTPLKAGTRVGQISLPQESTEYTIIFRTCPDHTIRKFVPGIGFTAYTYSHHGTIMDLDEHLVEFHQANR
jgi:hypothetical protein